MSKRLSGVGRVVFVHDSQGLVLAMASIEGKIEVPISAIADKQGVFRLHDHASFTAELMKPEEQVHGMRYRALPGSVKKLQSARVIEDTGMITKLDEKAGQFGFILMKDGASVWFTAAVVRPEVNAITAVFKVNQFVRFRAIEQQHANKNSRWRAVLVCSRKMNLSDFTCTDNSANFTLSKEDVKKREEQGGKKANAYVPIGLTVKKPGEEAADGKAAGRTEAIAQSQEGKQEQGTRTMEKEVENQCHIVAPICDASKMTSLASPSLSKAVLDAAAIAECNLASSFSPHPTPGLLSPSPHNPLHSEIACEDWTRRILAGDFYADASLAVAAVCHTLLGISGTPCLVCCATEHIAAM